MEDLPRLLSAPEEDKELIPFRKLGESFGCFSLVDPGFC
jgi:hypothetical protein